MPELLFGIIPNTPEQAFQPAPKTPKTPSTVSNCENNQFTPRTARSDDDSMTPEMQELVNAPCKPTHSPEDDPKPVKLSKRQLKFEDGVSLLSIGNHEEESRGGELFESDLYCEKKESKFVPLIPKRKGGNNGVDGGRNGRGGRTNGKSYSEKQHYIPTAKVELEENICHITPQKKNMPQLFGNNVTLDSPDPMSKFNSKNQESSDLQKVANKNTRISALLQNCKQVVEQTETSLFSVPRLDMKAVDSIATIRNETLKNGVNVSPDAVTDDIYDFDARNEKSVYKFNKTDEDSCNYPMNKDTISLEAAPPLQKLSDDEEFKLTSRVHVVRHKSVRIVEKQMTRRSLSPSLNTLERQLQQTTSATTQNMMPTSRSLDTLQPHTPNAMEEGQYIALKPTPPPSSANGPAMRKSFIRKSPQPPSTMSPKMTQSSSQSSILTSPPDHNKENIEANIRQSRGRRYMNPVSPVVEETKEDIASPPLTAPPSISQRPLPSRPTSNSQRRRPQPTSIVQPSTVRVEYCIKSPERVKNNKSALSPAHAADIPHPSPKRKKGDRRTVTVSGFSKQLLVSLITAASKKRRRRNKHQPAFSMKLEKIPEEENVVLLFPDWIAKASHSNESTKIQLGPVLSKERHLDVEKDPARLRAEEEYRDWLKDQVLVTHEDQEGDDSKGANNLDSLMRAIHSQNNDQFKSILNGNKNVIFARDENGNTALVAATLFGWKRGIKNLIKRGADLDAQNRFGNTSLHYASAFPQHDEIRRYLLRKQASATIRNERGICSCDSIS